MQLVRNAPIERLNFDDGWVDVKTQITAEERGRVKNALVVVEHGADASGKAVITTRADLASAELEALRIGIVAWSLPDPITAENIALLDDVTAAAVKARLDELWKARSDDDRKNLRAGGAPPSGTKAPSRRSSPGSP